MATLKKRTRKRDGVVVGEVRYYPAPGAKQVSVTIEGEQTAESYRAAVERAIADGAPIPLPPGGPRRQVEELPMTVDDFFKGPYMARRWPGLAVATQQKYRSCWNVHVTHRNYGISDRTLGEIEDDPNIISGMQAEMKTAGIGSSTINNTLGLLGAIFRLAAQTPGSGLRHHPMRGGVVEYESTNPAEPALPHTSETVAAVAAAMPNDVLLDAYGSRLYLMLMLGSGMRPGEVRALRAHDIREHTVAVWRAVGAAGEFKELKNEKWHYPPIPRELRDALRAYAGDREFVFPTMHSKDAHRDWTKRVFAPARNSVAAEQRARWPRLARTTSYDLGRHSFAAVYLRGGWWEGYKRQELASWLGHNVRTLENHYAGLIAEYQRSSQQIDPPAEFARAWAWLSEQSLPSHQPAPRRKRAKTAA
jgi:integrase